MLNKSKYKAFIEDEVHEKVQAQLRKALSEITTAQANEVKSKQKEDAALLAVNNLERSVSELTKKHNDASKELQQLQSWCDDVSDIFRGITSSSIDIDKHLKYLEQQFNKNNSLSNDERKEFKVHLDAIRNRDLGLNYTEQITKLLERYETYLNNQSSQGI